MNTLADFINDLTPRERAEADKALQDGEPLLWAVRPQAQLWCPESLIMFVSALPGLVFMGFWTHGILGFPETWEEVSLSNPMTLPGVLVSLPFYGVMFYLAAFPWLRRRKFNNSLYLLTNRRALVLEPTLFSWKLRSWELHEDMVLEHTPRADGRGDLVFELEIRRASKGGTRTIRHGFRELPDLQEAERRLEAAIQSPAQRDSE